MLFWQRRTEMIKPETIAKALREIEKGYAQYQYFFDNLLKLDDNVPSIAR